MNVNSDSQFVGGCARPFTVALVACLWAMPGLARADRVVLLPVEGAPEELVEEVEQQLIVTLRALGHEPTGDQLPPGAEAPAPESLEDFLAIAGMNQAAWTLHVRVESGSARSYWIRLRVASTAASRQEELRSEVVRAHEAERLRELLGALLRPEGLGADAERLGGPDPFVEPVAPEGGGDESEQAAESHPPEPKAAPEAAEADPSRGEARVQEPATSASSPARSDVGWYVTGGVAWRPILRHDPRARGGSLAAGALRVGLGRRLAPRSMHWRAGLDLALGDSNGFTLVVGGLYDVLSVGPVVLGALGEIGLHKATTGNDVWQAMGRVGAVGRLPIGSRLFLEATLPELTWLSANGGGLLLGGSVRLGVNLR